MARKLQTSIAGFGCIFRRSYKAADGTQRQAAVWWIEAKRLGTRDLDRRSLGTTDQAAAFAELARLHAAYQAGDLRGSTPQTITCGQLFGLLSEDYRRRGLKSLAIMEGLVKKHLEPAFAGLAWAKVRKRDIEQWAADRLAENDKPASINRTLSYFRRAVQLGADEDPPLVSHVPRWFSKLAEDNERTGVITADQYSSLRAVMPAHAALALTISYHTGMRRGLILSLRWDWVDMAARVIRIPPASNVTKKRPRAVPIYGDMLPMLEMARDSARSSYVIEWEGRRVFSIRRAWSTACEACGCELARFHDLRRTAATNALLAGVNESDILAMCGWQSSAMLRRYAQGMDSRAIRTGARMEEFLSAVPVSDRRKLEPGAGIEPATS
jgi:integrase